MTFDIYLNRDRLRSNYAMKHERVQMFQFQNFAALIALMMCLSNLVTNPSFAAPEKDDPSEVENKYRALETFARGIFLLENMYVDPSKVKQEDMVINALKGIVQHLDPHTMVMPRSDFNQFTMDTQGKFGGVGIIVSQERGKLIVVSPIEDTPAFKAGVLSGDEIVAIDGETIEELKGTRAVEKMRGKPGSEIVLTILREGEKETREFKLKREVIKVASVRSRDLGDDIIYVRVTSFQENTTDELLKALEKYKVRKGVILDLRDNPGGLLDQAVRMVDMFIDSGVIVSTVGRDRNRVEREFAHKRNTFSGFPMVVLVNGGSASASEIVAGALQDHQRALILGTTTFGKGSVQTLVSLPDGSGMKLTVARYFTPNDRSIQAKGITPDVVVLKSTAEPSKDLRKEADLDGHISSQDLSDFSKQKGLMKQVEKWPKPFREDIQLVSGYTYVKSWSIFQKRIEKKK